MAEGRTLGSPATYDEAKHYVVPIPAEYIIPRDKK